MIKEKYIKIITAVSVLLSIIVSIACLFLPVTKSTASYQNQTDYVTQLFDGNVIDIQIIADEKNWENMLRNAQNEEYIMVDVIVNGTKFSNVGIRPKGNSSLMLIVADDTTDRYSFKLKFDAFIDGQTCFGLDTLLLNNMFGDNTYQKEFISFDIMNYIGVDSALCEYSNISVNDKKWGFYLAIEGYDDSFLQRTYGDTGNLYSVKSLEINNMQEIMSKKNSIDTENIGSSNGTDLKYTNEKISSYSGIFENSVSESTTTDKKRIIKALKKLSQGSELETYFNVDQILRYLAAHTVVVNLDSYSSTMSQNYFLYEKNGKVSVLPWDYGLAFGGIFATDIETVINFPIDTPVYSVKLEERPLIEKLFENKEYLNRYHNYLQQIVDGYFVNYGFEKKIKSIDNKISQYVAEDPSAFCSYDDYQASTKAFSSLGTLRGESIQGQLDGTIPSTTKLQEKQPQLLISGENIDFSLIKCNSMMGMEMSDMGNKLQNGMDLMPDFKTMKQVMEIFSKSKNDVLTEQQKSQLLELGIEEDMLEPLQRMSSMFKTQMGGMSPLNIQKLILTIIFSVVVLIAGVIFVRKYGKRI